MPSDSIALSKNDPVVVACISAIKPSTWPALLIARLVPRASNQGQQQPGVGDGVERRARKLSAAQTRRQERQRAGDRFAAAFLAFTHFPALIASLFQGCHFRSWLCTVAVVRSGPKQHFERDPQRAARTNVTPRCRPSAPPQIVPAAASHRLRCRCSTGRATCYDVVIVCRQCVWRAFTKAPAVHGDDKSVRDRCRYSEDGDTGTTSSALNCRVETAG